jgi:minor extracellular serine protease Vpr
VSVTIFTRCSHHKGEEMIVVPKVVKHLPALAIAVGAAVVLSACSGGDSAQSHAAAPVAQRVPAPANSNVAALSLSENEQALSSKIDSRLGQATGSVEVWVSLDTPSLVAAQNKRAVELGLEPGSLFREMKASKQAALKTKSSNKPAPEESAALKTVRTESSGMIEKVAAQQKGFSDQTKSLGGKELGRVSVAHNAVALRIDASRLQQLAGMSGVVKVRPVVHYELALAETVPYVGGAAVQSSGFDGTGVTVAVVDSGIDYTHLNLGGAGTAAAYAQAAGTGPTDPIGAAPNALFPSKKVIGGFDFVGDQWSGQPDGPERTEDPNPIDYEGHGTHVADIIAGASADGAHKGMAPGATLLAVKACSSVSSSCNGVALLKAIDFILDPDGNGDSSDAADVINLSLGSDYGQPEDDLAYAVGNAVEFGTVVVASAGNGSNIPTITGSPGSEPGVLSVAQTAVPSAKAYPLTINAPAAIAGTYGDTASVEWAPVGNGFSGNVSYVGRGCPAAAATSTTPATPEDAYLDNPSGKIALIDRGSCGISLKVERAAKAGAKAVLIGLVAPGNAVTFINAGGTTFVPTLVITQTASEAIKANIAAPVSVTVSQGVSVVGSMASTSSRGPSNGYVAIKPEIGAPGASLSAETGTGNGQTTFGGTSGAAPMVAGAAAQLLHAFPERSPLQIKAMLMNNAYTTVMDFPGAEGKLAPIARIGAGELRVDRAVQADLVAYNTSQKSAALSYGFKAVANQGVFTQQLRLQNFSNAAKTVQFASEFRYEDDRANGAVTINLPSSVTVPARGSINIPVVLTVNASKLPEWKQDGRDIAAAGATFPLNEFDGYISITDGSKKLSVPWYIMPRKAADIKVFGGQSTKAPLFLFNNGAGTGITEVFALTGTSPRAAKEDLPEPGDNFSYIDMRAVGARLAAADTVQFGITTFGRRSNPVRPAGYEVQVDVNRDGTFDYAVYNDLLNSTSTLSVVKVLNISAGTAQAFFYIDADFYSGNMILTAPLSAMGLAEDSTFDFTVTSYDNAQSGDVSETIGPMTFTPSTPKFALQDNAITLDVPFAKTSQVRSIAVAGGDQASPSQTGLLFMHRGNAGSSESASITIRR